MQNVLGCCDRCPMVDKEPTEWDECQRDIMGKAIGLINRQKAKIERLKRYDEARDIRLHARLTETARTEAIKEFAERLCDGRVSNDPQTP